MGARIVRSHKFGIDPFDDMRRLAEVRTFFDVGANIGQTAKEALRAFSAARVFSFEPHPDTFRELSLNLPSQKRFEAVPLALSAAPGRAQLTVFKESTQLTS